MTALTAGALLAAIAAIVTISAGDAGAQGEVIPVPAGGALTITGHGNGHGHGMSQYGSRGAAMTGMSAAQIVAFYYPGTTLTSVASKTIRVLLSGDGGYTTVGVKAGLSVTGVAGTLPTAGYSKWRLVPSGSGLALQAYGAAGWLSYHLGLPARADFSATNRVVRQYKSDGSSADYYGTVGAVRSGARLVTVNRVALDTYVQGVAPRETPASWPAASLQAQAIAARSYAYDEIASHASAAYDICDTSSCQVYGGKTRYSTTGSVLSNDAPAALSGNANKVLLYHGAPVLAQYAASDGGASLTGGMAYLVTKLDPYDGSASGDPYLNWTRTSSASAVASAYGLASVSKIEITARSGAGDYGGWVTAGFVDGVDHGGHAQRLAATGNGLANAMNLPTAYFDIKGASTTAPTPATTAPKGHLDRLVLTGTTGVRVVGWAFDPAAPTVSTRVDVYVGSTLTATTANTNRADVQKVFSLPGAAHGFDTTVYIANSNQQVCVYAMDAQDKGRTGLGCTMLGQSALGRVDSEKMADATDLAINGWSFDPDLNGGPGSIVVTVGNVSMPFSANNSRADVDAFYKLSNPNEGFVVTVPVHVGAQSVCVTAKDVAGGGADRQLDCRTITVP